MQPDLYTFLHVHVFRYVFRSRSKTFPILVSHAAPPCVASSREAKQRGATWETIPLSAGAVTHPDLKLCKGRRTRELCAWQNFIRDHWLKPVVLVCR